MKGTRAAQNPNQYMGRNISGDVRQNILTAEQVLHEDPYGNPDPEGYAVPEAVLTQPPSHGRTEDAETAWNSLTGHDNRFNSQDWNEENSTCGRPMYGVSQNREGCCQECGRSATRHSY